ncbi:MAG TPA: LuxR C-terminal-related transcriptional regulator [Pseudonocardia sp.]|jgi:DNA-binding CsgD family transcriptional regulator
MAPSRSAPVRSYDGAAPRAWAAARRPLAPDLLDEIVGVTGRVAELAGRASVVGDRPDTPRAGVRLLTDAWAEAAELVPASAGDPHRLARLVDLLRDVKDLEGRLRDAAVAREATAAQVVRAALAVLRDLDSMAELADRAPAAAAAVGFDRVVLSRIDESTWVPETAYVARDERWAEEILRAGRADLRTLDASLLETQIVRRGRALTVSDLAGRPDLHRALVDTSETRSYVVAPIMGWGRVVGFLHADCYHQRRDLDAVDRDLLWAFSEGLGVLITRAVALDGLSELRGQLTRLASADGSRASVMSWGNRSSTDAQTSSVGATPLFPPFGSSVGTSPEMESALTRREVEVLRLMSAGHTNGQIARRLVISEGTVKSHVKHVLRKLAARNRAEAVSMWLRGSAGHGMHDRANVAGGGYPTGCNVTRISSPR